MAPSAAGRLFVRLLQPTMYLQPMRTRTLDRCNFVVDSMDIIWSMYHV